MKNKKAFTMVELIAIIVILVLIVIVTLPNLLGTRERQIEREFNNFLRNLFIAAENHLTNDRDLLELLNYHNRLCITIGELREEGLISGTATNPRDDADVEDYHFVIIRVKDDGSFEYDYIIDGSDCLPTGTLMAIPWDATEPTDIFLTLPIRRNQIESIETRSKIEVDINVCLANNTCRDVSAEQNKSIIAWWEPGDNPNLYKIYIGSHRNVVANENSSNLFINLTNAIHLNLTHLDTSNVNNLRSMFVGNGANSIEFGPNFDTSNVVDMINMFVNMQNLTEIITPAGVNVINWDTSKVTDMNMMFAGTRLSSIEFGPNFVTSNVTNMHAMFSNMNNLTEIITPAGVNVINWDTKNVTSMTQMFQSTRLSSIEFGPNFVTNNVTTFNHMFAGMSNLNNTQGLNIRHFNFSNVTDHGNMFFLTPFNARLTVSPAGNTWLNNNGFSAWNNRVIVP